MNKGKHTIFMLSLLWFISCIPMYFSSDSINVNKVDIYLFFDYAKYPEHIAYDIYGIISFNILMYLVLINTKVIEYRRYVWAFFATSLLGIPWYFLFYSQYISLVSLPLLAALILLIRIKHVR
jgi:hypothetical protein